MKLNKLGNISYIKTLVVQTSVARRGSCFCYCMGQLKWIMPLTVNCLMLSLIILKKLADCDSISPTAIGTSLVKCRL